MTVQNLHSQDQELQQILNQLATYSKAMRELNKKLDSKYGIRLHQSIDKAADAVVDAELEVLKAQARIIDAFADLDD